jgi:gamma-glutamyltranspeptidase/glutathione hydrolase
MASSRSLRVSGLSGLVFALSLAVPMSIEAQTPPPENGVPLPVPGRSVVTTTLGIVATSHPLAAQAGVQVLERGGNAMDAAIAANAAIGLMEQVSAGIGGDMFAIVYTAATGEVVGLNASGWSPAGLTKEFLASEGLERLRGIHTVTVPGAVGGWQALHDRFGKADMGTILAPAIWYAENGYPVGEVTANLSEGSLGSLQRTEEASRVFLVDGERTYRAGEIHRNPDLAETYRLIAEQGRDGFYKGPVADAILSLSDEMGGTMTAADLADYEPEWVTPLQTTYNGWTIHQLPPNGIGIAALSMLNVMENFPIKEWGFHSPEALHVMIEAKKLAYADMIEYVADPRVSSVPVRGMLDKANAKARAGLIDLNKAACSVQPSVFTGIGEEYGGDTIYLTVIDAEGNIVSFIQSVYSHFGSGLVPQETGFVLHNRGSLFTLEEGHPNMLEGHKRPLNTIIPAFMENGDQKIGFGIMGGFNQPQAHAQFVSNIVDHEMNIQQALGAGRFTKGSFDGCDVNVENLVPEWVLGRLGELGHEVRTRGARTSTFGYGQAVMSDGSGVHFGASDRRHDGAAMPQRPRIIWPGGG